MNDSWPCSESTWKPDRRRGQSRPPSRFRRPTALLTTGLLAVILLAGCSGPAGPAAPAGPTTTPTASSSPTTSNAAARSWGRDRPDPGPVEVIGATGSWRVEMLSAEWIPADDVHGDRSDGWAVGVQTYLAVDVRYTAVDTEVVYSTLDWTYDSSDGQSAVAGTAGGGGPEVGRELAAAGTLAAGAGITGRVYFGFDEPTSGTLSYTTLADGVQGSWWLPLP